MKFDAAGIRNFAVAGHSGSGKTSLCDLMLFKAKAVERLGSVDAKSSVSDYTPDEQEKRSSIYASFLNCKWRDMQMFFIDTPGYGEFVGEVISSFKACDSALVVLDGVQGLEMGATRAWKFAKAADMPRMVFINRLDKEMSDFSKALGQLQEAYGKTVCVPMTLPVGRESSLKGVVSVLGAADSAPEELKGEISSYREQLMDAIAESDEDLMAKYLEGEALSEEEISKGLQSAILSGKLVPVFAGSVAKDVGVSELMDGLAKFMPAPLRKGSVAAKDGESIKLSEDGDAVAFVFKSLIDPFIGHLAFFRVLSGKIEADSEIFNLTNGSKERFGQILMLNGKSQVQLEEACPGCICAVAKLKSTKTGDTLCGSQKGAQLPPLSFPNPVMSYSVSAVKSGEEDKIMTGLGKLCEGDPTLKIMRNSETHEALLCGMGDQHLSIAVRKLKESAKVDVELNTPKVPYRETITGHGEGHYRHKKQSGGHGQFAEVHLKVAPNPSGYEFVNAIVGGSIPKNFIPAVEKGVHEAMEKGPLAGCVVEKMTVTVFDGKYHDVDSSEMAFKIASRMAFRDAMAKAKAVLLEPIMTVKIMIPDEFMGDITGHLNHKRGRILGMGVEEGMEVVNAEAPLAEMAKYATELRSMTQGRGSFEMEFDRYEVVPSNVANEIIAKHKQENKEEE